MSTRNSFKNIILFLTFCVFIAGLAACTSGTAADPRAWIDFPREGATIPVGSLVTVISHASAQEGVAEVLLSINGEPYRRDLPEAAGASFSEVRQEWLPDEAGLYTLQVRTYDATGAVSNPHGITVRVVSEVAAVTTDTPTETETAVPTDTPSPTHTPTLVPPTPILTPTPIPPTATFTPTPIPPTPTFTPTPVPPSPTYTPTPTVTPPPPDTTPPPVPSPMVPADELHLSCRSTQILAWLPVTDDSGIAGYDVKLERQVVTNQWDSVAEWGPIADKQFEVEVQCGPFYRWAVRALDGAGNISNWSAWSHFSVGID